MPIANQPDHDRYLGQRLKLRDLQLFFDVVAAGSMAKAAARLGISQPSVSEVIASLERVAGVRLLDRSPRGVEPTVYGRVLLERGLAAFDELKQGMRDIGFLADPSAGSIRIACTEAVAAILHEAISTFLRSYARAAIHVDIIDNRSLNLPTLRNRECDVVLGHFSETLLADPLADDLDVEPLFNDWLVVAAGAKSPWADRSHIRLTELAGEPWILSAPSSWNYRVIADAFSTLGMPMPTIRIITYSAPLRSQMLASGGYIATYPNSVVELFAGQLGVRRLAVDLPLRFWPMSVVTLKHRTLSEVVIRFVDHLRAVFAPLRNQPGGHPLT